MSAPRPVPRPPSSRDATPLEGLLIVQTAFPGDVILTGGLVRSVREAWPQVPLGLLVRPDNAALAEMMDPDLQVMVFDKRGDEKGTGGLRRLAARLREGPWEAALVPHRSFRSALLARWAALRPAVGFETSAGALLLTRRVPYRRGVHEVRRNHDLLAVLAYSLGVEVPPLLPPVLEPGPEGRRRAAPVLEALGEEADPAPFVALAPGSVWPTKRWPAGYWAVLGAVLAGQGLRVVWIGGPEDADLGASLAAGVKGSVNAAGRLDWPGTAALLARARLLVANDSAPVHLAGAVGCPVLAIFGPTLPGFGFGPFAPGSRVLGRTLGCRPCRLHGSRRCPEGHFTCMLDLSPGRVTEAVLEILETTAERR
jgi:heptosyltransferase-2